METECQSISASNSVSLPEGSVSGEHAILVIQQFTKPDKTFATLKDNASKTGTFINGEPLVFGQSEKCKNGDILRFGGSYECLLILFDVRELGLKKAEEFISDVEDNPVDNEWDDWGADDPYKRSDTSQEVPFFNRGTAKGTTPMNGGPAFGGGKHNTEIM